MVGMALAKSLYSIPTWTRTVALAREHAALREAIGGATPSVYACYRFATKLRRYGELLDACIGRVTASLRTELPEYGTDVAIDASDVPAFANGQRYVSKGGRERERFSDPDASWGHRSAVSTRKGRRVLRLPRPRGRVCRHRPSARVGGLDGRKPRVQLRLPLLDVARERGFAPETCALDKGYDFARVYEACEDRDVRPILPLRETPAVKAGKAKPPTCEHGEWRFAGSDTRRMAAKWRCPTGRCSPASRWIKADRLHPLIPRETPRWRKLYKGRASVEREFGRLKNEWALLPLRVRGLERVQLHADLTVLSKLAWARAVPLAA
jgi:Transposase DDE domain